MKKIVLVFAILAAAVSSGSNLLTNSSFENALPLKKSKWKVELFKEWKCILNSGNTKGDILLSAPGYKSKQALRLRTLGKSGFNAVIYGKDFPVTQGQKVTASVMMKGSGTGYIRIYHLDKQGKRVKTYTMQGTYARKDFAPLIVRFTVPAGVAKIRYSLETLRNNADVIFDDAKLEIEEGDVLENDMLRITFDPRLGGGISSFVWKEKNFDFTCSKTLVRGGGMANCVIPANRIPGVFYNQSFTKTASSKEKITYTARLTGPLMAGLVMSRTYTLLPDGVKMEITLANKGKVPQQISWRIQNFISSDKGIWSWPTPDWVTILRQTGAPLNGLNSVSHNLFRAGWEAKYFEELKASLLFEVETHAVRTLYCYMNMAPRHSTAEWYYREFKLAPGAEKKVSATFRLLKDQKTFYADAHGRKQKFEVIEPIKMPKAPEKSALPSAFNGFFAYTGGGGNLNQPEMAGFTRSVPYPQSYAVIIARLFRIQTEAYINSFAPGRLIYGVMHKNLWKKDGSHILGEMLKRFDQKYFLSTLFLYREDVDVKKYMKEKWPKLHKTMTDPDLQRFIKKYQKNIPVIYTGDELLPQNVDVMLKVNEELGKILPKHIQPFPYLNSSAVDILPYVPVFVGDWYPIKRSWASGRNPWNVYTEFSALVKRAGETPVWFMPQGFSGSGLTSKTTIYAFPTAGETRLMLNLAIAAGVKGISWHGFPSGTWPWMMNYSMYRYSFLGGAGQKSPAWVAVKDIGRNIASAEPLLAAGKPLPLPAGMTVKCNEFTSYNKFYSGPAVKPYAIKTPGGMLFVIVNQNPVKSEKCQITLPGGKGFDLVKLNEVKSSAVLELLPGDAAYIYCGKGGKELDAAFKSRFRAERARYLLRADIAAGFGVKTVDPDTFKKLPALKALQALLKEQSDLEKRLAASKAGKLLADIESTRQTLDKIEFRLCCALDIAVTPEMRKATRRYGRFVPHPDKKFQSIRMRLAKAFAAFYALSDAVDNGGGYKAASGISKVKADAESAAQDAHAWLDNHPEKALIDDPMAF